MRVGVLSDSHDNLTALRKAVEVFSKNGVEALIHAGDFCSPFVFPEFKPLVDKGIKMQAVFGNNDGDRVMLVRRAGDFCSFSDGSRILSLDGRKVVVMHYPDLAEDLFRLGAYDLVIYGHNHKARLEGESRKLLNPGTCAGYLADAATIALLDTSTMAVEMVRL